jgi:D-alanyl-D-alanine carboxypeptidase
MKTLRTAVAIAAAVVAAALALTTSLAGASSGSRNANLQKSVDDLVAAGAPGAVLFVRDGQKTTTYTAGVADLATSRPIAARDRYRIASLTKTYTATVVLQLVAEGKLRMSDSVERWLPGLVPNGRNITIRHLLGHTSGLFDFEKDPRLNQPYFKGDFDYFWSPKARLALATSHDPLYAPGQTTTSTYSNTNYTALGLIVEAATRKSIGSQLRRRIFEPLHLSKTTFPVRETKIEGSHSHGYFLVGQPPLVDVTQFSPSIAGAGGAIVSTVGDVATFYRALLSGRLLERAQLNAMKTTLPSKGDVEGTRYGLGIQRVPTPCGPAWGHSGGFPGYLTYALSSGTGARQSVLMVNIDPGAMPDGGMPLFFEALRSGYCTS